MRRINEITNERDGGRRKWKSPSKTKRFNDKRSLLLTIIRNEKYEKREKKNRNKLKQAQNIKRKNKSLYAHGAVQ